jgi:uncharacterized membrane protein (DUF485 family)
MTTPDNTLPTETPNIVIEDPKTRKRFNTILSLLLLIVGVAALFFAIFPEAAFGTDIPARAIQFLTAVVTFVSAWFGLGVTNRNYPKF